MRKLYLALGLLGVLAATPLALNMSNRLGGRLTSQTQIKEAKKQELPKQEETLVSTEIKESVITKTITLESRNTVVFRGPVTGSSVAKAMKQLQAVSRSVSKDTLIYLVLDTPGGSIGDGLDLIDFAKALPQKIVTVTLFAASMGFQIAQNLDTRYIVTNGTLMSHRARVGGMGGQIKGEFESRYKMIRRSVDLLDFIASKRMGLDQKAYESMIVNEYWVYGFDAINDKAADEEVLLQCGESMSGNDVVDFETMFGVVKVTFNGCPLIKTPEAIDFGGVKNEDGLRETREAFGLAFDNKRQFVKQYITTDRFFEIFR